MALTTEQRINVYKAIVDYLSRNNIEINITKTEFKACVNAIDDWIDTVQSSFNSAIPEPARSSLTGKQKVQVFKEILVERWEVE